jgi:hypothetical protein
LSLIIVYYCLLKSQVYPCLEKINHAPVSTKEKAKVAQGASETGAVDADGSQTLLQLFRASHHGTHHDSYAELNKSLAESTHLANNFLQQSNPMLPSLKEELSKLLISVMKQSAFLR